MTRFASLILLVTFSILTWNAESAKILAVFPMPAYSHFSLGFRVAKELADRGHQVTAINPYPQKTPIKNYKDISVEEHVDFIEQYKKNLFNMNSFNPLNTMTFILEMGNQLVERTYSHEKVQDLMKSGETFDVMILEHFIDDALVGLGYHFNVPVVLIGPMAAGALNNYIFANPAPSSYVPNALGDFTKGMSFWKRTTNLLLNVMGDVVRELFFLPAQRKIFKKYVKTDLQLDDVLYNVSLMLTNSHVSVNDAIPHVPNIIEIGGYHVNPPKKLPEDLQKFLDGSKDGVILFSMGSNLKSKDLQPEVRDAILKAFSKIKQKVLWKFEEELPNAPKNLKIMKWVPQQDVLAHPNIQAFISHGGLLSTIEAVYHGVPIIGIPVFGDQKSNVARAETNGYALGIPLQDLSEEKLTRALTEILNNPKYRENIKRRSKIMHDQPLKPIDTAIYWIEHVIRHQGAPHLRSAGIDLKWYQRDMLDIAVFLTLVTVALTVVFYVIIKKILGLCFRQKPRATKSKKNK